MYKKSRHTVKRKKLSLLGNTVAVVFFLLCTLVAPAQNDSPGYYIKGEALFRQKRYYEAIQYYEKYLATEIKTTPRSQPFAVKKKAPGKSNLNIHNEVVYRLAESYRMINNYTLAEKWYKEAMSFSRKAYPACPYWYGVSLRANQKYGEAFEAITAFRESYTKMDELLVGADKELENLKFIREQLLKERDGFFVERKQMPANTSSYALSASRPDHMVYTAVHEDKTNGLYVARLYEAARQDETAGKPKMIALDEAPGIHNGMAAFLKGGKKIFFTRWMVNNGITTSAIYSSDKTDTGWTKPVPLPEPVNMEGSNSAQPFITSDGKYLLFSSNREGGVGKYDIWYAPLDTNGNALLVTNAGNIVNTAGDEASPSYHHTSRTLLFSSNGHIGMGGYDIFSAKGDFQLSNWDKPVNAGKPINSSKDDLYFISTDEDNLWNTGWLSSDRATDCCLELFAVRQDNAQFVSGSVTDCSSSKPLAGVTLTIKDPKGGKVLLRQQTRSDGYYSFQLKNTSRFEITAEKEGYLTANESYKLYFDSGTDSVSNNNICLSLITAPVTNTGGYDLSESTTLAKFAFNQSALGSSSFHELDSLAALMHQFPSLIIEVGGYTDGRGSAAYNLKLAQKRVDACIRYLVKKGISKNRLAGKAYGECCPLEAEKINGRDNPKARERNRRVEYREVKK